MVAIDIWLHGGASLGKPKLMAKIVVVCVLTANGVLLHLVAFPILTQTAAQSQIGARIAATLGAVSTTSWLFASFLGTARFIAPYTSLHALLGLYFVALAGAVAFALVVVSRRLERMLSSGPGPPQSDGQFIYPPHVEAPDTPAY